MLFKFIIKRLLIMLPEILGITFISFVIISLAPGNILTSLKMNPYISEKTIKMMEQAYGLNKPLLYRYGLWLWNIIHFNLGISIYYHASVLSLISSRALNTLILSITTIVVSWLISLPAGIISGIKENGYFDRSVSFASYIGISLPSFLIAFILLLLVAKTGILPTGGTTSPLYNLLSIKDKIYDRSIHLIMPVTALAIPQIASYIRLIRANIIEIKYSEFVTSARARGLNSSRIIYIHILKNALNPFVTLAGYDLAGLLGGAALVETILNLQGLGTLLLKAVMSMDVFLIMGDLLIGAAMLLIGNLISDIALMYIDPRIKAQL
ncbi:MAG: ABC transporter permease [Deltaproteobacteria bacterium]|nr:ABC transporter permease [Deltaproteobacteria bacterium]MCL5791705.1 ABC transporter permease [Deltaproteobacteria bacterium]